MMATLETKRLLQLQTPRPPLEKMNTTLIGASIKLNSPVSPVSSNRASLDEEKMSSIKRNVHKNTLHQSILDGRIKQLHYFLKMGYKVDTKETRQEISVQSCTQRIAAK